MLVLTRRIDEKIRIGDNIVLTVLEVRGEQVRIGIEAPRSVSVHREEVWVELQTQNLAAASPSTEQLAALSSQFAKTLGQAARTGSDGAPANPEPGESA